MKLHQAVADALRQGGVDVLFGVLGDANMLYVTDYIGHKAGTYIGAVDERGAVLMATGYARIGNRVGVAAITHGPAVTNALTAIVEASRARTPIVVLTGDTPAVRDHLQQIDLASLVAPTGAVYQRVHRSGEIFDNVAIALRTAQVRKAPVLLDIPITLLMADVEATRSSFTDFPAQAFEPDDDVVDRALGVIASARRPLVLAGRGAVLSGAGPAVRALAETLGAPVATSLLARDFFRDDPFDLGVIGTVGSELALKTLAESDCVIVFGAGLNHFTTAQGSAFAGKAVIQVDTDPEAFGRFTSIDVPVLGDARISAAIMTEQLRELAQPSVAFRSAQLAAAIADDTPAQGFTATDTASTIDVRSAMMRLDELLPPDRVLVTDVGRFVGAPWRYLRVADPLNFAHSASFGSIGLGIATAVGAAAARRERVTVAVVGDGGAMMGLIEFSTAVREQLPLVVVVVNDGCYGAEWSKLRDFGADPVHARMDWPDLAQLGRALGGHGVTVTTRADLDQLPVLLGRDAFPLLVDVKVAADTDIGLLA